MIHNALRTRMILTLIVSLGLTGCAEVAYERLNDPSRDTWQKPQGVIETLSIAPGSRVADLGAGGGYFTWHLAKAVGPRGTVYAVDINKAALDMIFKEMVARGTPNVRPVRATPNDPRLPEPVDLVFSCNTYHQMIDRDVYFRSLASSLRPGGRVAILDFEPRGFFSGMFGNRIAKEDVRLEMEAAGYRLVDDHQLIDQQHFQIFEAADS
ncbi:MAG: methyltransferase domain-containing protein [Nitrospira sp.]|nr:methyltransferase domain-containing protein [Nitrospira sp.]MDH4371246.1 methyltransferase domain-containing protein [Nitrospira sp.]MDH5348971.1 methyltransferase domain-containing protein [Nitrospira sp.]MDH5498783.1 methyltransferase domain-containing protein [Nitrospira sp.]MDH5726125.1 methyltransferase domain-containing protein [Nitrospira sp.]